MSGEQVDPRVLTVGLTLVVDGERLRLTAAESRSVLVRFATVRAEAAKWTLKFGKPGRLLLVDEELCGEISAFLDASS